MHQDDEEIRYWITGEWSRVYDILRLNLGGNRLIIISQIMHKFQDSDKLLFGAQKKRISTYFWFFGLC
jgi:hypothetical protein